MHFRCNFTIYGRYVHIRIPGVKKTLTLCEVEVYSSVYPSKRLYSNIVNVHNTTGIVNLKKIMTIIVLWLLHTLGAKTRALPG